jgi:protein-disulfide isomerase
VADDSAVRSDDETRRRLFLLGGVLVVAVVVVLATVLLGESGDEERASRGEPSLFAGIPQDGPWLGRAGAPVVVEEFLDLQCPFCARFATRDLPGIVSDFVRPGRVRMRMRVLAFLGPDSVPAGQATAAAGLQNRQWDFAESFYARQRPENSGYVTDAFLREVGASVQGLDVDRALQQRGDPAVERRLREDTAIGQRIAVPGTPTFLVSRGGGRPKTVGAEQLRAAIEAAAGDGA